MRHGLLLGAAGAGCVAAAILFFSAGGAAPLREAAAWISQEAKSASIFFVQSITVSQIQNDYQNVQAPKSDKSKKKSTKSRYISDGEIRVLIVPGHQPEDGGTAFDGVYERDIVVDIAGALAELLAQDSHYEVMVARGKDTWNPVLQAYFDTRAADIKAFEQSQELLMESYLASGSILPQADHVYHNSASPSARLQLYGINKWASENTYDITLHLHLNDYARRRTGRVGTYDGFRIYVPERQYSNAEASIAIAEAIAARLNAYHATSTLPQEDAGVVEDQELIAIGTNNTADSAALLIEYGYIYEPQFQESSVLPVAVTDYAYATYLGLQDFFGDPIVPTFDSVSFPYDWSTVDAQRGESGPGIYALQAMLHRLGYYPPAGESFSECPVSGKSGSCTRRAIEAYQNAHGLETTGALGPKTREALERELTTP